VAPVGLDRLQVRRIHYTAQIDIVAEGSRSDRLASIGLNLLLGTGKHIQPDSLLASGGYERLDCHFRRIHFVGFDDRRIFVDCRRFDM
jgi:hypothetical protein